MVFFQDYIVLGFTLQESQEELRECLAKTNLIEWQAKPMYVICDESIIPLMKEMLPQRLEIAWECYPLENIMYITKEKIAALKVDE